MRTVLLLLQFDGVGRELKRVATAFNRLLSKRWLLFSTLAEPAQQLFCLLWNKALCKLERFSSKLGDLITTYRCELKAKSM